jgi:DNA polymerase
MANYPTNLLECNLCSIREEATQVVPGCGPKPADIMFIGQNPGDKEDEAGTSIIGPSGKWLDRILKAICHSRDEVYITNTVKCRTPDNRLPEAEEIETCAYWLIKEVKEVNPVLVIPLGAVAMQAVLCTPPDARITEHAGKVAKSPLAIFKDRTILPLLHPQTLAYNRTRNYEPYCQHVANLFQVLIDLGILEANTENWREGFRF